MKRIFVVGWLLAFAAVEAASLIPHLIVAPNETDKFLHLFAFCSLMLLPVLLIRSRFVTSMIAVLLFGAGALNEFLQEGIGGRKCSLDDILVNGIGILLAFLIGHLIIKGMAAIPPPLSHRKV